MGQSLSSRPRSCSVQPEPSAVKAIAFDVNGTLVEINTDDHFEQIFRSAAHFLSYQGIDIRRHELHELYFLRLKQQQRTSPEKHPEFDAVGIWAGIIDDRATDFTRSLPAEKLAQLPLFLAEMYRGISRYKLRLYPGVRETLDALRGRFPMALITDAQSAWARAELNKVGLLDYFDPIVVSGDYGYRKPDKRLFLLAIEAMGVAAEQTLYVGNDMHRDIYGAREAGMQTVMFNSDQGEKEYAGTVPDHWMNDYRELLDILGVRADPQEGRSG
jgi:putative hydrolase of the HAD superfamily